MVRDTSFVAMCGQGLCILCVRCSRPLAISVPRCPCRGYNLPSPGNAGLPFRELAATASQGLLCEQNVNPSLDGLLDLFN